MTSPLLNRVTPKDTIETWRQKTNEIVDRLKDLYPHVDNNLYVENDAFIKGNLTVDGQLHVKANLIVDGTTTTINTTELNIEDNTILLNSNLTGTPPNVLESGIEVNRGSSDNKRIYWDEATDKWNIEGDLNIEGNFTDISGNSFRWGFDSNTNSIYNLNTGKVGIGTSSPGAKLDITENSGGTQFRVGGTSSTGGQFQINNAGSDIYALFRATGSNDNKILLHSNGDSYFKGGQVGIGTTSPGAILNIAVPSNGTIGTLYTTTRNYNDSSNRVDLLFQYKYNSSNQYTTGSQISLAKESTADGNYGSDIRFLTRENGQSSSEKMRIQGDGKVGIGTTSPEALLTLQLDTGIGFVIEDPLSERLHMLTRDGSGHGYYMGFADGETVGYKLNSSGDSYFVGGDVGIGTSSPAEKLEVAGAIKLGTTSSTNTGTIRWSGSDFEGYTGSAWESLTSGGSTSVWSTNGNHAYYNTGKVGIGTTSPYKKLEVTGDLQLDANSASLYLKSGAAATAGKIYWTFDSDTIVYNSFGIAYDSRTTLGMHLNSGYPITLDSGTYIDFSVNGTAKMRMDSTGKLGIGTTSPSGNLHVESNSSSATQIIIGNTAAGGREYHLNVTANSASIGGGNFAIRDSSANAYRLTIDSDGKVGIGTTSPSYELEVDGKIHASDGIHVLDRRTSGDITPLNWSSKAVSTFFTDDIAGSSNSWDSGITVKGWDDAGSSTNAYRVWQLFSNSSNMTDSEPSASADDLYFRSGVGNTWGTKQKVWTDGNFDPTGYLPLSGGTITGVIDAGSSLTAAYRFDGRSFSWNSAMQNPTTYIPHIMQRTYGGWDPIMGIKTSNGFWQFGAYSNDTLFFGYMSGAFGSHSTNSFDDYLSISPTAMIFSGSISATGNITSTSDINLKENLEIIENPIEKIKQINGYTYNMIGKDERFAGLVAQEVEEVLPEVVRENIQGTKSLAYGNLMALLVETVKEQQKQIDELKKLISDK